MIIAAMFFAFIQMITDMVAKQKPRIVSSMLKNNLNEVNLDYFN